MLGQIFLIDNSKRIVALCKCVQLLQQGSKDHRHVSKHAIIHMQSKAWESKEPMLVLRNKWLQKEGKWWQNNY